MQHGKEHGQRVLDHLLARAERNVLRLEALHSGLNFTPSDKPNIIMPNNNVSQFAETLNAFFDREDVATNAIIADNKAMKDELNKLNNSPGTFSPADQSSVDSLIARVSGQATKLESLLNTVPPTPPSE